LLPLRSVNMAGGWMIDQYGQEGSVKGSSDPKRELIVCVEVRLACVELV
jgi:hypothetical protein